MNKNCENCHAYKPRKCFTADGICYLVPSKPKFVRKTDSCKHYKEKKEVKQ